MTGWADLRLDERSEQGPADNREACVTREASFGLTEDLDLGSLARKERVTLH